MNVSETTLTIIEERIDEVVTMTNSEIADAILLLLERAKQFVEGAGASSVATIRSDDLDVSGEIVMPLLCGGNLDMTMSRTIFVHTLTHRRQLLQVRVRIDDKPGKMAALSGIFADHDANIHTVHHDRAIDGLDVGEAYLTIEIETSGAGHAETVLNAITDHGYSVEVVNRLADDAIIG